MKKKLLISLGIFIILLGVYSVKFVLENKSLINPPYSLQAKINRNFDLNLNRDLSALVIFDNTDNFRTDGEVYFTLNYRDYTGDEVEKELELLSFNEEKDTSVEEQLTTTLTKLNISKKQFPQFNKEYKWKIIQDDNQLNTLYMIYIVNDQELYVYGELI